MIREYWNLARAWSDYRWAIDEAKRFEVVVPARGAVDAPMLSTARAAAAARVNDAQLIVESAQAALMRTALVAANGIVLSDRCAIGGTVSNVFLRFIRRPRGARADLAD